MARIGSNLPSSLLFRGVPRACGARPVSADNDRLQALPWEKDLHFLGIFRTLSYYLPYSAWRKAPFRLVSRNFVSCYGSHFKMNYLKPVASILRPWLGAPLLFADLISARSAPKRKMARRLQALIFPL